MSVRDSKAPGLKAADAAPLRDAMMASQWGGPQMVSTSPRSCRTAGIAGRGWRRTWLALGGIAASICAPDISTAATSACFTSLVAAIDIGHSRSSPGAKDMLGRDELQYNSELATAIEGRLAQSGIGRVVVVNRGLDMTSLAARPQRAFCLGADLLVSIHHDSVDANLMEVKTAQGQQLRYNDRIEGYTVYYSSQNVHADLSRSLGLRVAEALLAQGVVPATPYQDAISDELRRPVSSDLNVFDFQRLKVSLTSPIPAILLEAGFLSNRKDMQRLQSAEYRTRIADGVVQGLKAMCARHPEIAGLGSRGANRPQRCSLK